MIAKQVSTLIYNSGYMTSVYYFVRRNPYGYNASNTAPAQEMSHEIALALSILPAGAGNSRLSRQLCTHFSNISVSYFVLHRSRIAGHDSDF
jgi:hypothetical protein